MQSPETKVSLKTPVHIDKAVLDEADAIIDAYYNLDEQVREICIRRREAIAHEKYQQQRIKELTDERERLLAEHDRLLAEHDRLLAEIARAKKCK